MVIVLIVILVLVLVVRFFDVGGIGEVEVLDLGGMGKLGVEDGDGEVVFWFDVEFVFVFEIVLIGVVDVEICFDEDLFVVDVVRVFKMMNFFEDFDYFV